MRKGADCLSKWVGEAERQLRLLFEEARHSQPSIIFFDEIDGLAPVRSSKQDQIHASIVSTLLALMDGMDGRGQVVVIGATNRPDAVDPALRRPGRFDREFYFPLPSLEAREKILGIMTKGWEGWGVGEGAAAEENVKGLARLTKGYGGADLRVSFLSHFCTFGVVVLMAVGQALCTEAALNAIQRRYPQIYASNDRLLIKPETIGVTLRDFMISVKSAYRGSFFFFFMVLIGGTRARALLGKVYCDSRVPASEPTCSTSGRDIRPGQGFPRKGTSSAAETDCPGRGTVGGGQRRRCIGAGDAYAV